MLNATKVRQQVTNIKENKLAAMEREARNAAEAFRRETGALNVGVRVNPLTNKAEAFDLDSDNAA
jgi:hypothetical protein